MEKRKEKEEDNKNHILRKVLLSGWQQKLATSLLFLTIASEVQRLNPAFDPLSPAPFPKIVTIVSPPEARPLELSFSATQK